MRSFKKFLAASLAAAARGGGGLFSTRGLGARCGGVGAGEHGVGCAGRGAATRAQQAGLACLLPPAAGAPALPRRSLARSLAPSLPPSLSLSRMFSFLEERN